MVAILLLMFGLALSSMAQKAPMPVSDDHEVQISAILSYLHEVHGFSEIESWFAESLRLDTAGAQSRFKDAAYVSGLMGVEFNPYGGLRQRYFSVFIDAQTPISISGYDHMVRAGYGRLAASVSLPKQPLTSEIETTADSVVLKFVADGVPSDSMVIPLSSLIDRVVSAHADARGSAIPAEKATIEYETAAFKTKVVMFQARFQRQDSTVVATSYDVLILYSRKSKN